MEGIGSKPMKDSIDRFVEELQEKIMEDMRRKYSQVAIDHWIHPKNFKRIDSPDGYAKIKGPCGDTMEIFLKVKDGKITDCSFLTDGCGGSIMCGSMTVELTEGKKIEEVKGITQKTILDSLGGLPEDYHHCALLAANTLKEALKSIKTNPYKDSLKGCQ